jgi:hypothetical protein
MNRETAMEKALDILYAKNAPFCSEDIIREAQNILCAHKELVHSMNEYNSLSDKNVHSVSNGFSRKERLQKQNNPKLLELSMSTIAEFLPEYWLSLNSAKERLIAVEVYNRMRERLCR